MSSVYGYVPLGESTFNPKSLIKQLQAHTGIVGEWYTLYFVM